MLTKAAVFIVIENFSACKYKMLSRLGEDSI